jgi:hypothetical protein
MVTQAEEYFRHLGLVREDVREELELIDLGEKIEKLCDFGCGTGLTTYTLALELEGSECIGIDRFDGETSPTLDTSLRHAERLGNQCRDQSLKSKVLAKDFCRLLQGPRTPQFKKGDFLLGHNLPCGIDLAYCKRILVNTYKGHHGSTPSGEEGLFQTINHIAGSVRPGGYVCVIEYNGLQLDTFLQMANLSLIMQVPFERNDIRSLGRTKVTSHYVLTLCRKRTPKEITELN